MTRCCGVTVAATWGPVASTKDAASAVVVGGAFDKASEAITARLYPDKARLDAEEARRFGLLEEHWDVIVTPAGE